ncbi:MAG: LptF/LptG family permease [Planctomycetaceae bacterium]
MNTYDKYLSKRLLHTFSMLFIAAYGLFVVIDLFMNIDEFQEPLTRSSTPVGEHQMFRRIGEYYFFRLFEFFELAGPILIVISVIAVLGLLRKSCETFPLLAAGVPTFRLVRPLLLSAAILNLALIANQEFAIPTFAVQLQTPRGSRVAEIQQVEPVYDYSNSLMHISGDRVLVSTRTIENASFSLPETHLKSQHCILKAETARFVEPEHDGQNRRGWLLRNLTSVLDPETLTEEGRRRIIPLSNGTDVFIQSEVTFDQLYNRGRNLKLLSSTQLVHRIRNTSTGEVPLRAQSLALHTRIARPITCLLSITIALPLVIRRESRSLITNMAVCSAVLGGFYGFAQGCQVLGMTSFLAPDLAAWLPVIASGMTSASMADLVQT